MVGIFAGILYLWGSAFLIWLRLDDVVDAVPVHFLNGLWGCIAAGLLSEPGRMLQAYGTDRYPGFFYSLERGNPDGRLLGCQILGCLFIIGWSLFTMAPFFLALNYFGWLRSEAVEELVGLDVCYNGEHIMNQSKAESDGDEMRGEFLDAYEDYRRQQQKSRSKSMKGSARGDVLVQQGSQKALFPKNGGTDNGSGSGRSHDLSQEIDFDDTASV